jgi:hypothetical protein
VKRGKTDLLNITGSWRMPDEGLTNIIVSRHEQDSHMLTRKLV